MDDSQYNTLNMQGLFKIINIRKFTPKKSANKEDFIRFLKDEFENYNRNLDKTFNFEIVKDISYPPEISTNETYSKFAENIIVIQYSGEVLYEKIYAKINDEFVELPEESRVEQIKDYIFIIYPNLILFKGTKDGFTQVWSEFTKIIKDKNKDVRDYWFDLEYFMYLMQKIMFSEPLDNNFRIIFLEDILFDTKNESVREILNAEGLMHVLGSKYVNLKLLENNKPSECIFYYKLDKWDFSVKLTKTGKVDFLQNNGSFKKAYQNLRAFMGCYFVDHLIHHYDFWTKLDVKHKFIDDRFIRKIIKHMKIKENINCEKASVEIINHYNKLKGVR